MLKRLFHVAIVATVIAMFAEHRSCATPSLALPPTAADWNLASLPDCVAPQPADLHTWRGTSAARRICRAEYGGVPFIKLTIYEMPDGIGTSAFDAFQQWHTQPGRLSFFKGRYFGVVESPQADPHTLYRFAQAMEAALPRN